MLVSSVLSLSDSGTPEMASCLRTLSLNLREVMPLRMPSVLQLDLLTFQRHDQWARNSGLIQFRWSKSDYPWFYLPLLSHQYYEPPVIFDLYYFCQRNFANNCKYVYKLIQISWTSPPPILHHYYGLPSDIDPEKFWPTSSFKQF